MNRELEKDHAILFQKKRKMNMIDILMLGSIAALTLAVLGIAIWSGNVVRERSDDR